MNGVIDLVRELLSADPDTGYTAVDLSLALPGVGESTVVDALIALFAEGLVEEMPAWDYGRTETVWAWIPGGAA